MTEKLSVSDMLDDSNYQEQKAVLEEVSAISYRLRRAMDAGLTPADMQVVSAEKAAADAAAEILSKIFN